MQKRKGKDRIPLFQGKESPFYLFCMGKGRESGGEKKKKVESAAAFKEKKKKDRTLLYLEKEEKKERRKKERALFSIDEAQRRKGKRSSLVCHKGGGRKAGLWKEKKNEIREPRLEPRTKKKKREKKAFRLPQHSSTEEGKR